MYLYYFCLLVSSFTAFSEVNVCAAVPEQLIYGSKTCCYSIFVDAFEVLVVNAQDLSYRFQLSKFLNNNFLQFTIR